MIEHVFAALGVFVVARLAFREALWRLTRDQNGYSGRFGHWSEP